jgi:hypothetical protein
MLSMLQRCTRSCIEYVGNLVGHMLKLRMELLERLFVYALNQK